MNMGFALVRPVQNSEVGKHEFKVVAVEATTGFGFGNKREDDREKDEGIL